MSHGHPVHTLVRRLLVVTVFLVLPAAIFLLQLPQGFLKDRKPLLVLGSIEAFFELDQGLPLELASKRSIGFEDKEGADV